MTLEQFINREIATWGEDYIFSLLDRGYVAIQLTDNAGEVKWSWIYDSNHLTNEDAYATVVSGAPVVSPVSAGSVPAR